jgi:hypothetical protein
VNTTIKSHEETAAVSEKGAVDIEAGQYQEEDRCHDAFMEDAV